MSKNVDFEIGTIVTDTFLDGIQELLTGSIQNLRFAPGAAADQIQLNFSGDTSFDNRGTINVGGRYCYIDVAKDSNNTGTLGNNATYGVFLSTTDSGTPQQPDFNVTVAASPPASSYLRRLGEITKNVGGNLTNAKMYSGVQPDANLYNSFTFKSVLDYTDETLVTLSGQTTQVSPAGTYDSSVSTTPTKALSVGREIASVYTERLYVDTEGRLVFTDDGSGDGEAAVQFTNHGAASVLTTNKEFSSHRAVAGQPSFSTRVIDIDAANRITIYNDGEIEWGSGVNLTDTVNLSYTAANRLEFDTTDQLWMPYAIPYTTSPADGLGSLVTNKLYVDTLSASAVSESKRFAFFITP